MLAPISYVYLGKLAFICFGPTSKYFAGMLAMGGQLNQTVEEKKRGQGRRNVRLTQSVPNRDREVGADRGLSLQSKIQCTMMAQNEDDAEQHHYYMRMVMMSKQIKSTENLVELKLKTSERMSLSGSEAQVFLSINILMKKLETLNEILDKNMMNKMRKTNPIARNVLAVAAKAMGVAKRDKDSDNNVDFVSGIFK